METSNQKQLKICDFYQQDYKRNSNYFVGLALHKILAVLLQIYENGQLNRRQRFTYFVYLRNKGRLRTEKEDSELNDLGSELASPGYDIETHIENPKEKIKWQRNYYTKQIYSILQVTELKWLRFSANKTKPKKTNPKKNEIPSKILSPQQIVQRLIFGYIHFRYLVYGYTEDMTPLPYDIKQLIANYYGNIIIASQILSLNQIVLIGYSLRLQLTNCYQFYFQEISTQKHLCLDKMNLIIVVKTNTDDILVHFHSLNIKFSILLQTSVASIPVMYRNINNIYHFPNNYEIDVTTKMDEIFVKHKCNRVNYGIGPLYTHNLSKTNRIFVNKYEIFQMLK